MSNFYGGLFYNGGFFGAVTPVDPAVPTGGKDDTPGRKRLSVRRSDPFKPTGIVDRPKSKDHAIDARLAEQAATQADIAGQLAREFAEESAAITEQVPVVQMSLAEIEHEIGLILRKKLRTQEDDAILMLLLVASAVA